MENSKKWEKTSKDGSYKVAVWSTLDDINGQETVYRVYESKNGTQDPTDKYKSHHLEEAIEYAEKLLPDSN